jgi:hypothetical protein
LVQVRTQVCSRIAPNADTVDTSTVSASSWKTKASDGDGHHAGGAVDKATVLRRFANAG